MHADLLIENAAVYTLNPAQPEAEAVAVRDNRIVFVGSNAEAAAWRKPGTRVVDAGRSTLLPGLVDSHFHLQMGALRLDNLQLDGVRTLAEMQTALAGYAAEHNDRPWISGQRLAYTVAGSNGALTRHDLDAIVAERPVALMSLDFHTVWANTRALELAGILHGAETPAGSEIEMAPDGTATGRLNERGAFNHVLDLIPPYSEAEKMALLRRALAAASAYGITSVHNLDGDATQMARYAALEEQGDLTLRMWVAYSVRPDTPIERLAEEAAPLAGRYREGFMRAGSVKFFMDGVIDSYTAFMVEPYAGRPDCGDALWTAGDFTRFAGEADRLGLQIVVHAIGDAAVRRTLDSFAAVNASNGPRNRRHRIEHIELLHPADLARFAELGVVASMQPLHASRPERDHFMGWTECIARNRWRDAFPWRAVHATGARLIFGSDWPVVTMDPYAGIEAAVNRRAWGEGLPNQAVSLADALAAYTFTPAWVEFREDEKGRIRPGMLADLVLLDADIFALTPESLALVRPQLTVCDGRVVYER